MKLSKKTAMRVYCYCDRTLDESLTDNAVSPDLYEAATQAAIHIQNVISHELGNDFVCDCILAHGTSTL